MEIKIGIHTYFIFQLLFCIYLYIFYYFEITSFNPQGIPDKTSEECLITSPTKIEDLKECYGSCDI